MGSSFCAILLTLQVFQRVEWVYEINWNIWTTDGFRAAHANAYIFEMS